MFTMLGIEGDPDMMPLVVHILFDSIGLMFSGKTFTMLGTEEDPGMIPRVIHALFQNLVASATAESAANVAHTHKVSFSYLEIYNEKVR